MPEALPLNMVPSRFELSRVSRPLALLRRASPRRTASAVLHVHICSYFSLDIYKTCLFSYLSLPDLAVYIIECLYLDINIISAYIRDISEILIYADITRPEKSDPYI